MVINNRTYYRTSEACRAAGVSRSTFFRWLTAGVLEDVPYKDRRGWRLFTEGDIRKIREEANRIGGIDDWAIAEEAK
jgi:predicted site-specific integrase-resolvase